MRYDKCPKCSIVIESQRPERIIKVNVGNLPPGDIDQYMETVKERLGFRLENNFYSAIYVPISGKEESSISTLPLIFGRCECSVWMTAINNLDWFYGWKIKDK